MAVSDRLEGMSARNETREAVRRAIEGGRQTFSRMEETLETLSRAADPKRTGLAITRTFDAPRMRVFEMWTKAEHRARW